MVMPNDRSLAIELVQASAFGGDPDVAALEMYGPQRDALSTWFRGPVSVLSSTTMSPSVVVTQTVPSITAISTTSPSSRPAALQFPISSQFSRPSPQVPASIRSSRRANAVTAMLSCGVDHCDRLDPRHRYTPEFEPTQISPVESMVADRIFAEGRIDSTVPDERQRSRPAPEVPIQTSPAGSRVNEDTVSAWSCQDSTTGVNGPARLPTQRPLSANPTHRLSPASMVVTGRSGNPPPRVDALGWPLAIRARPCQVPTSMASSVDSKLRTRESGRPVNDSVNAPSSKRTSPSEVPIQVAPVPSVAIAFMRPTGIGAGWE